MRNVTRRIGYAARAGNTGGDGKFARNGRCGKISQFLSRDEKRKMPCRRVGAQKNEENFKNVSLIIFAASGHQHGNFFTAQRSLG
jgi:hypothetical protein